MILHDELLQRARELGTRAAERKGDAVSEVEAIIKTLFHVCSCPSLAFGLPPHPHGWSPTGSNQTHGCPTCFLCRITAALAADREKQHDSQQDKRIDILLDENCVETIKRLTPTGGEEISFGGTMGGVRLLWKASCGPSQAAPGTVAAEEDTVGNRSLRSSSAQEQLDAIDADLSEILGPRKTGDVTSVLARVQIAFKAREAQIRRDAHNKGFEDAIQAAKDGKLSDGYHSFAELYEHRHVLFAALIRAYGGWKSLQHDDGTMFDGWFIAGVETPKGQATYHLPICLFAAFPGRELERAPKWDGHTPHDVLERISALAQKEST